ncbi:MAG: sigma-70 family RNA polymerase sigma factor [Haliscomenobacteraceae bacterium CHB4]|nr:sigma-70 family RNA polymerase sigma factor [Haliscomenobacteraceae bacterium CHB4]
MTANTLWTDESLMAAIQSGGQAREDALRRMYLLPGLRETVTRFVLDNGGSRDDAQDVFQEALVLFDRNLREGRFEGKSTLATYFVAIAKWRWVTLRRQQGRYRELSPAQYDGEVESAETETLRTEHRELLTEAMGHIGERCRELLRLYQLDYTMEEIAQKMGYSGADVAKKEAYRCRMRLREHLENNPLWAEYLDK